jgi:hypothetical protein
MENQYVYVMSNPSFSNDIFKIGFSTRHPSIRAKELCSSGVPTPFVVEYIIVTTYGKSLEYKIHKSLKSYRINSNREFFQIEIQQLVHILQDQLHLSLISMPNTDSVGELCDNTTQNGECKISSNNDKIPKYQCAVCKFYSPNKTKYTKHLATKRHKKLIELDYKIQETQSITVFECEYCQKVFKHQSSLCKHKKNTCSKNKNENISKILQIMYNYIFKLHNIDNKTKVQDKNMVIDMKKVQHLINKL